MSTRAEFEQIALPHAGALHATARRVLRTEEDASDAVQETFLRAYRTYGNFRPGTNARAWLFTILHSVIANTWQRARRAPKTFSIEAMAEKWEGGFELQDPAALSAILGNPGLDWPSEEVELAVKGLRRDFRIAVLLVDVEDFSYEEAAAICGCPTGTLRSRLFRGRRLLATALHDLAGRRGHVVRK
ncbi:MAG: sigma-70 family RNA polymerase sigma factor [Acidobacteria bacterium]|nr:sigma-70 family RNA polymerase sigma factor [Acidobacteriota bacterium]